MPITGIPTAFTGDWGLRAAALGKASVKAVLRLRADAREISGRADLHPTRGQVLLPDEFNRLENQENTDMAKGEQRGNREVKKPKKEKIKVIAAAPSQKAATWQPGSAAGRKK